MASARRAFADVLAQAEQAGDVSIRAGCASILAELELLTGYIAGATADLREALDLATRIGNRMILIDTLCSCGHLCLATGRWAEAVTIWRCSRRVFFRWR